MPGSERYEYVKAIVDCGSLRWEYKLVGSHTVAKMDHDEDVEGWTDEQITSLTRAMLDVDEDNRDCITIEYR